MTSLIVGALISIPLSILANILTPKFQAWNAKRSRTAATNKAERERELRERVQFYIDNPVAHRAFMHLSTVESIWYAAWLLAIMTGVPTGILIDRSFIMLIVASIALPIGLMLINALGRRRLDAQSVAIAVGRELVERGRDEPAPGGAS